MHLLHSSILIFFLSLSAFGATTTEGKPKRELKNNMVEVYNILPPSTDSLTEVFTEGMLYGRLRMNSFVWDWSKDDTIENKDNYAFGLGGSLIYKTAPMGGLSATAGVYYSDSPFAALRADAEDIGYVKAGKDTFSRNSVINDNDYSMLSLAQIYLQYQAKKTTLKAGRQDFESLLISSNDTKMIPNTFEGLSAQSSIIPNTIVKGAYFYAQKLRDHTAFHDVITYNTASGHSMENQDDAAVHKGLSYANFTAAGETTDHALIVADLKNKSFKDVQIDLSYHGIPHVLSSFTTEINYIIQVTNEISITPGVRYMRQIDNGGGAVGGASLDGNLASWQSGLSSNGYTNPKSLDSSLTMARLLLKKGPFVTQIAYSQVADEADIVAPWRGFPTGGYTRAITQYNWIANTKTTSAEIFYDFSKYNIIPGFSALVRYAIQNYDENKQLTSGGVQADSNVVHLDFRQHINAALNAKVRVGLMNAENRLDGRDIDSYNEYRFELNYLF